MKLKKQNSTSSNITTMKILSKFKRKINNIQ